MIDFANAEWVNTWWFGFTSLFLPVIGMVLFMWKGYWFLPVVLIGAVAFSISIIYISHDSAIGGLAAAVGAAVILVIAFSGREQVLEARKNAKKEGQR